MSTIINNSGITFPNGNTQTSAAIVNSGIPVFSGNYTSSTTISNGSYVKVPLNSICKDTHSGWVSANNSYTIQKSGYYQVNGSTTVLYAGNATSPLIYTALTRVNYNNSVVIQSGQFNSAGYGYYSFNQWGGTAERVMYLTAGNSIWLETLALIYGYPTYVPTVAISWLNLYYIRS